MGKMNEPLLLQMLCCFFGYTLDSVAMHALVCLGMVCFHIVQPSLALCICIKDHPAYRIQAPKVKENISSCAWVNTVYSIYVTVLPS
jgi:hypothetical protein